MTAEQLAEEAETLIAQIVRRCPEDEARVALEHLLEYVEEKLAEVS